MLHLEQKWRSQLPTQSGGLKRTKVSTTGAYSSSSNPDTPLADESGVDSPVRPQRVDATGRRGLSPLQKCTAAIRMLAYGVATDVVDDYVCIDESTTIECLEKFVEGVISVFEDEYLRRPNPNDVRRLLQMTEDRGFPSMLGSINCMHWQ
ncbi:uncharacterized protein LOC107461685 [Arachis duranensis]|uniref:Uncharacterized protein LOC107461685 n=1 Tax=Arachis duranensis TaxID=130453 RepID=A0A6P4C1P5_ARADU|nr:uncharacterized protein LOC107461685 [Arachis duranensis]